LGAPVKPLHSAGDERIVIVRFYPRVTNLSESQEVARKSANPELCGRLGDEIDQAAW
jgi:hypothetical protein